MPNEAFPLAAWGYEDGQIAPLEQATVNRNFLLTRDGRQFFLRQRHPRYADTAQILFDHALMRHLAAHGVRGPDPIPTRTGETVAREGEAVFELHAFLVGQPFAWGDLNHLKAVARALKRFHDAAALFEPPLRKAWPREDAPPHVRQGLAELREAIEDPAALRGLDYLDAWVDHIQQALPDTAYWGLPCQIIHGDFHPGNVLIARKGVGIFDLDCASRQPRARDLADAFLYFCAKRERPFEASDPFRLTRECRLDPERNHLFLNGYGAIETNEREALPWMVAARWIHCRVRSRRLVPKEQWPAYVTSGILTPLRQLESGELL